MASVLQLMMSTEGTVSSDATRSTVRWCFSLEAREHRARGFESVRDIFFGVAVELEGVLLPLGAGTHVVQVVDEGARRGLRETDGVSPVMLSRR